MLKATSAALGAALCIGLSACAADTTARQPAVVTAAPAPGPAVQVNNATYAGRASLIRGTESDCVPQESPFGIRVNNGMADFRVGASNMGSQPIARDGSVNFTDAGFRVTGRFAPDGFSGMATRASCTFALGAGVR
jgi:streptogramin lyase